MSLIVKLIISLVIAVVAATLTTLLRSDGTPDLLLLIMFCLATAATALIVSGPASSAPAARTDQAAKTPKSAPKKAVNHSADNAGREEGQVKWFNVSKGFGFITKDDGEEIFVHFRSIRGEGRRGLRDGQRVSFIVAQSDKGPQAEDVEGME
jgi:CspA family cold shock protein